MVPNKQIDPLGILGDEAKKQADPLGILKKKEPSQVTLSTGGKAGTSEAPSGFGDLKPAKIQPVKIEGVGEEVGLGRPKREVAVSTAVKPVVGLDLAKEKAIERAAAPKLPKTEKEIGEVEAFFNSLERGLKQGQIADMMALGQMPSREDLKEIARLTREQQALPASGAYEKFNSAPDLSTAAKEFIKNPFEISSQLIGESLSALVRHGATRGAAGAGMGAALGSVIPGFGTATGAGLGYLAGSGVAGYNLEMASSILDSFKDAGVDVSDEKSLQKAFDDPATLKKARDFANKRAIPIALFDMFSAGMGGKLLGKPAKTMLQKVGRGAAEVGVQAGLAGAGEATAQKVSGQKFNPTAIFAEMVGETGGGAPDIIVGTVIERKKQGKPTIQEVAKLDIKPEELQDMLDVSEATGELTDAQADEIKNEYTKVQEVRSVVPEQYKKNAEVIEALQKKKELEQQKKGLDPVFAKKIDAQIAEQEARIDRATEEVPQVPQTEETLNRYLSTYRRQLAERRKELTEQGIEDVEADEQVQNIKSKIGSTQERMAKLGEVAPVKEEAVRAGEVVEAPEAQVPAAPAKAEVVSIDEKETIRQMKPFTDEMANIEREFENRGLRIDTDYDNEIIVTDRQGNILDPEEIPADIADLAAAYEQATMKLGEFDQVAREKALEESRKVEEVVGEEVAPQVPATPIEPIRQLGTGSNVYFENDKYRVNDYKDKTLLNVQGTGDIGVIANLEFNTPEEAVSVAKKLNSLYPQGVPEAVLLDKVVEDIKAGKYKEQVGEEAAPQVPAVSKVEINKELANQSEQVENILGLSTDDADALAIIHNANLTPEEKKILWRQFKRGVMNLNDIKKYSGVIDLQKLQSGDIDKWARVALEKQKSKVGKFNIEDIDFEDISERIPQVPAAPITEEEIKTEEYAIPEPSPTGVLQPTQERAGEEGGGRRRMESPVERVAAAQKSKTEAAKKEIERRLTKYAAPTGKQSEVNNLVEELKVFNSQKRGRLGLKKIESLKKRNELILEAKRLGFETKVYKDGSIAVKGARAIDKTFSNYSIDDKFVPLGQRGEKLKNLFNRILGLADAYGYGFDFFIPNVIIGADGKKMSTKQISNAVRDLENGIPSKGASAVLNSLEAMAEKGEVEVRVGQAVETVDIEDYFNRLEKDIADRDMELALMQEAETLPEKDLVKWVEEMAEEQSFETEIYEPDTEEITGEGREEPKIKGEGKEVVPGTAGGVVPPTRRGAPPTAASEEGERVSGIKKGLVSERILAQVDFEKIGDKELLEAGKDIIASGEVKPKALVDKILEEKSGVLSPAEVVALITYKTNLDNKIEDLSEEIATKEAAGEDIGTLGVELKSLEVERDNFDMAAVITAQQQSMSFRLRRFMLDRDFNLTVAINKYKKANNGVIPAEVEEVFKEVDSKIKEVNKKLKEEAAKVYEKEGEEAAKNIVDDVQREQAEKVAKNRIEKARKKRALLLEKYRKGKGGGLTLSTGGLSTEGIEFVGELLATYIQEGIGNAELIIKKIIDNFKDIQGREPSDEVRKDIENIVNDELARPFMAEDGSLIVPDKFIRSLVSKGATTIEQMTDAAFAELEPQVPGLTKRQVRDAITKYGKKVNPRIDELTAQINQAKRIGRLISELEDLQKMSPSDFIIKYKKKKPSNTTEAEKVLRKQINVLKKELDIDAETRKEERRIEKAIKDAEESLAEYQRRIDELDFSARERGLPETPELKKARQARDEKRKEYESLKRLRPSTRLDASKKAVRKKIEELQERLRTGNYSKTPKAKKLIDAELYILNAEKEALQERVAREQRKLEKTTVRDVLKEIANIPRTLVSGLFDMGAAFSQGVYRIYSNPILSAKAFTEGAKQFFSEKRHDQWLADLRSSPEFKLLKDDMKIAISDPDGKISEQEGVIIAKYANFLYNTIARAITFGYRPATKLIQSLNPILASQRAFDGYMNYIRVNSALKLAKALENDGYTPESNPEVFEQAGDFVNTTTGRASLGSLDKSAGWLSSILFAPRKVAAELKLFTPYAFYYYAKMPAAVRKRALLNFGTFAMSVIASHTLLKAALDAVRGDDEEEDREFWDSDSPNFMSFKIGNQRVSFLGGVKTTIVFMSRLLGDRFVDQFGRESKFGERFGKKINTKLDLVLRFGLGKLAPTPGVIRDIAEKPNYEDYDEIYQNVIMPIWLQDAKEMQKDNPAEMQALFHLLGFVGANVRTVNPDSMKDKIVFKEKVRGEEVKRNVNLTEEQVIDFQNIYNNELKKKLRLINTEINRAADDKERAKVVDAAREKARNAAQEKLEIKHKTEFRKFPEQEKEKEGKALQRAKEKMN